MRGPWDAGCDNLQGSILPRLCFHTPINAHVIFKLQNRDDAILFQCEISNMKWDEDKHLYYMVYLDKITHNHLIKPKGINVNKTACVLHHRGFNRSRARPPLQHV